jgi:type VI secretion system protein VasD
MLLPAMLMGVSGCTAMKKTLQVLKDPSIAVGELTDQPSQVALSLVTSDAVNPNAFAQEEPLSSQDDAEPYRVNLSSDDLGSLLGQLKATTDILQNEFQARHGHAPDTVSVAVEEAQPEQDPASHIVDGGDGVPRQVGQYRADDPDPDPDAKPAAVPATPVQARQASPIAVKVFELKDNGVFLAADADALMDKPEKTLGKTYVDHDEYVLKPDEFKFIRFHAVKPATHFIAVVAAYQDTDSVNWKAVHRIEPTGGRYPLLVSLDEHGVTIKGEE